MTYERALDSPIPFAHPRDKWKWATATRFDEEWTFADATLHLQRIGGECTNPEFTWRMHDLKEMFKTKPLIGLAGKKHSGKSTVAEHLVRAHAFREFAFADRIKAGLEGLLYDWIEGDLQPYADIDKEAPIEGLGRSRRELWKSLGDWMIAELGDDILIRGLAREMATHPNIGAAAGVVVSDVRLEKEAAWIRGLGGQILHIVGPRPCDDEHRTEVGLECQDQDLLLTNSGDRGLFIAEAVRKLNQAVYG